MSDRFNQGMRDVPDTLAPHDAIEAGGRARRRRRAVIGGSIAAVLVAAGTATAIGLTSGGSGNDKMASGSAPSVSAAGQPSPAAEATDAPGAAPAAGKPQSVVAKGESGGKTWELVRSDARTGIPGYPTDQPTTGPGSGNKPVAKSCDYVWLQVGGTWAADISGTCTNDPAGTAGPGPGIQWSAMSSATGTKVYVTRVTPEVSNVSLTFADGVKLPDVKPTTVPGVTGGYAVFTVPANAEHGKAYTVTVYGADGGKLFSNEMPNVVK